MAAILTDQTDCCRAVLRHQWQKDVLIAAVFLGTELGNHTHSDDVNKVY
jgi:hypothetical protein